MPRRIIIDTDPGIDDAIAILLALAPPGAFTAGKTEFVENASRLP